MEKDGILTAKTVREKVSQSERFGMRLKPTFHILSLARSKLKDVTILSEYEHLQYLDLAHNKIRDLSFVSHMPYLIILDASHNDISGYFQFDPPKKLQEVNLSHNRLGKMKPLKGYGCLSKLLLDRNSISEIAGLENCVNLTYLSLAHNKVVRITGLDGLPLKTLNLRGNQLRKIEGLEGVTNLQVLDLSSNRITSLQGLQNLHLLCTLNMEKNQVVEINECRNIQDLELLSDLNLGENPIQGQTNYRQAVVFLLQHLSELDQEKVTAEEKVESINQYDPPIDVVAARDHMSNQVYQLMQPQVLFDSTLPSLDTPYPLLAVTGPRSCGKKELIQRLCREFSGHFRYGISHTTREQSSGEQNGVNYHFVTEDQFQKMIQMGKFIHTVQFGGQRFGLSIAVIESAAREGLACCVHLELEGVFGLKQSSFRPKFILLLPTQIEKYKQFLRSRGIYTTAQVDAAVARVELYNDINRDRPGFFDHVIRCDDWDEAYQMFRRVVMETFLSEEGAKQKKEESIISRIFLDALPSAERSSPLRSDSESDTDMSPSASALELLDNETQIRQAEEASIRRKEQLVREAIVGRIVGVQSQLFKRYRDTPHQAANLIELLRSSAAQVSATQLSSENRLALDKSTLVSWRDTLLSLPGPSTSIEKNAESAVRTSLEALETESGSTGTESFHSLSGSVTDVSERPSGGNIKPILPPIKRRPKDP